MNGKDKLKISKRFYAPSILYDEEYDILSINWCPHIKVDYSIETENGFVFDLSGEEKVIGLEIFNFKKQAKQNTNKSKIKQKKVRTM